MGDRLGDSGGQAWSFRKEGRALISGPSLKGVLSLWDLVGDIGPALGGWSQEADWKCVWGP